jgi:hypothetical protein
MAVFIATNSDAKTEDFENHMIGALFMKMMNPVLDLLVTLSPA